MRKTSFVHHSPRVNCRAHFSIEFECSVGPGQCIYHTPSWPGYRTHIAERKALMLGHLVGKEIFMMIRRLVMRNMVLCILSSLHAAFMNNFFEILINSVSNAICFLCIRRQ